jgi:hypothetical protein
VEKKVITVLDGYRYPRKTFVFGKIDLPPARAPGTGTGMDDRTAVTEARPKLPLSACPSYLSSARNDKTGLFEPY